MDKKVRGQEQEMSLEWWVGIRSCRSFKCLVKEFRLYQLRNERLLDAF